MRKFIISVALLASTVAIAAPAAAQWAPPAPQGYAYGYQGNTGQTRRLEVRIQQIRNQIRQLDRRNILSNREANRLEVEARRLQYRVRQLGYNGLNQRERYDIERRIARLEWNVRRQANDGNRRYSQNSYGQNGYYNGYGDYDRDGVNDRYDNRIDRDRDGRDDRHEDDRGHDDDDD
ncbi:MAG: hypothetical protein ABIP07_08340 [Sphingomicrobium sp.]